MNKEVEHIRDNWPIGLWEDCKPSPDSMVVSINIRAEYGGPITKDVCLMEPNKTEWDIEICDDRIISCTITQPDFNLFAPFIPAFEGPVTPFTPSDIVKLAPGPKLLKPEKPKKVVKRRMILD